MPPVPDTFAYDVVIVTFNSAPTLGACLDAAGALEPAPSRVLVVDNRSTDRSSRIAHDSPFDVIDLESNTGFTGGMNRALDETDSPWVLLLNPDCAPRPDFVARLLEAATAAPDGAGIGSLTGLLLRADGEDLAETGEIDAAGMVVTPEGRHFDRMAGEPAASAPTRPAWVFGGTGAATLYRRSALEDVAYPGGEVFAPTFFAYREDAELAWRLQWRSWSCLFVPEAVALHGRGFRPEMGRCGREEINRLSVRNRFLLRAHCADVGWHLRCFPWWLVRDLLVVGACLTVERTSFRGLVEALRLHRDARERRRWVLGRSRVKGRHLSAWFRRPCGLVMEVDSS